MKLYGYRNGRTFRALWALEEVGATYEYVEIDLMRGEAREPKFLDINPAGKVPVLDDGGTIITESAAICMHLAEKYPQSRLLPPAGSVERSQCYKWTSYVITELDAPLWTIAKHRFALPRERRVPAVIETASWEFRTAVKVLAAALGDRPYFVGDCLTVADIVAGHTLSWAKSSRLTLASDQLERYLDSLLARDTVRRAQERAQAPSVV